MPLFLLVIFGVYGALHVYTFLKIKAAFPFGIVPGVFLGIFLAVMTCAPVIVRILERHGYDVTGRILSYIGYSWMGVLFIFFSLSLLFDLYRLFIYTAGFFFHKDLASVLPPETLSFLTLTFLALCIAAYGYHDARNIRTEMITVRTSKLPETIHRLRIVQISDIHLGIIVRQGRLQRILKAVNEVHPDILVSTGDLVDSQIDNLSGLADTFKKIQPRYGKYAVTGNHEFYAGLPHALEITTRAGFTVLRNDAVTVSGLMNIAGVDDPTGKYLGLSNGIDEEHVLSQLPRDAFTLLLKHQPKIRDGSLGLFDLQLSGHTHKGQIFPFRYLVQIFFPRIAGWYDLPKGSHLYVNRGTGTWGPPIRFLSPPEITVIDLIHENRF
jgi:uncharacterized protein